MTHSVEDPVAWADHLRRLAGPFADICPAEDVLDLLHHFPEGDPHAELDIPRGWLPHVLDLHRELVAACPDYELRLVTLADGQLRFGLRFRARFLGHGVDDIQEVWRLDRLIRDRYERPSLTWCAACGAELPHWQVAAILAGRHLDVPPDRAPRTEFADWEREAYDEAIGAIDQEIAWQVSAACAAGHATDLGRTHARAIWDLRRLRDRLQVLDRIALDAVTTTLRAARAGRAVCPPPDNDTPSKGQPK